MIVELNKIIISKTFKHNLHKNPLKIQFSLLYLTFFRFLYHWGRFARSRVLLITSQPIIVAINIFSSYMIITLMELIFMGTKFPGLRGLVCHPRNSIPTKLRILVIHEIQFPRFLIFSRKVTILKIWFFHG